MASGVVVPVGWEAWASALESSPGDGVVRGVFADWLEELGEASADGWRALGRYGRSSCEVGGWYRHRWHKRRRSRQEAAGVCTNRRLFRCQPSLLPWQWFARLWREEPVGHGWTWADQNHLHRTRFGAEWAAAAAWVAMSEGDRAECGRLLSAEPEGVL